MYNKNINLKKCIAVVTGIECSEEKDDVVTVFFDVLIDNTIQSMHYIFTDVFTNGRAIFERFLIATANIDKNTKSMNLEECMEVFFNLIIDEDTWDIIDIEYLTDEDYDAEKVLKFFKDSELTKANVNDSLKKYTIFPYNYQGFQTGFKYFGYIKNVMTYKCKNNPSDITIRLCVTLFNDGNIKTFDYYINGIYSIDCDKFEELCNKYNIDIYKCNDKDSTLKEVKNKVMYVPSKANIYNTNKGTQYIYKIDPFGKNPQIERFMEAYLKDINNDFKTTPFFYLFS